MQKILNGKLCFLISISKLKAQEKLNGFNIFLKEDQPKVWTAQYHVLIFFLNIFLIIVK